MISVKPHYEILTDISEGGVKELKLIERMARICYKSEAKITEGTESAEDLIKRLIKNGHEAMLEHSSLSVIFTVDRGVSHELVRHRLFSFAQESTRYCKYGDNINVIEMPDFIKTEIRNGIIQAELDAEMHYLNLLKIGAPPQIARAVLPTNTKTDIGVTGNYREWRHFFKLRTSPAAHPQIVEVALPLLRELQQRIPIIFDDCI